MMSSSEPALHDAFVADDVFGAPYAMAAPAAGATAAGATTAAAAWMPAPLTPGAPALPDAVGDAAFTALLEDFAARPRRGAPLARGAASPAAMSRAEAQQAAERAA
ncbi:MAG TPA: hypothetical protein VEZ47_12735, partial [Gemmatirosa sp.]|nr:hypothetical protein [Gemmatirosa sp.]